MNYYILIAVIIVLIILILWLGLPKKLMGFVPWNVEEQKQIAEMIQHYAQQVELTQNRLNDIAFCKECEDERKQLTELLQKYQELYNYYVDFKKRKLQYS
jgi:hypothetical protein